MSEDELLFLDWSYDMYHAMTILLCYIKITNTQEFKQFIKKPSTNNDKVLISKANVNNIWKRDWQEIKESITQIRELIELGKIMLNKGLGAQIRNQV